MSDEPKISMVMSREVISIDHADSLETAHNLLRKYNMHHLIVLKDKKIAGIITSNDLLNACFDKTPNEQESILKTTLVHKVMSTDVVNIEEDAPIREAASYFSKGILHALPVVDNNNFLVGIVSTTDLIRYLANCD